MKKILVIEDEELLRASIVEFLNFENFYTLEAENGFIGVQLAQEQLPDLIICDVLMPKFDGYSVLTTLRQNLITTAIPFIFTTSKASKADLRQGMDLGADDYLSKPFTANELLRAVTTRLKKQAASVQTCNSQIKQLENKINNLAHYDSLTNLPNQLLLQKQLKSLMIQADTNGSSITILSISLEQFNQISTTLGQTIGNLLLSSVAERLSNCVYDIATITRLQADHFVITVPTTIQKETTSLAQSLLSTLSQPFILKEYEIFVTINIGIAFYPCDGKNIDALLKNAGIAMYIAKQKPGNSYQFYNKDMHAQTCNQLVLNTSLHYALERAEFQVYYQPQVDLKTGQVVGAEALLRWYHPEQGLVSPANFIPEAEQNGLIIPIGDWVLTTACQQIKFWQINGFPHLRVAVNLSGCQFSHYNLSKKLVQILAETNLEPKYLELELTESTLVNNVEATIIILNELKSLGIQISIDDFGTGYSSLSYLKKFPFDTLKLDRSFVSGISDNIKNATIATAIIQMGHGLNLKVIAEGVETEAELAFLYQQQCDEIQGYLFSHPIPAAEFEDLLVNNKRLQPRSAIKHDGKVNLLLEL